MLIHQNLHAPCWRIQIGAGIVCTFACITGIVLLALSQLHVLSQFEWTITGSSIVGGGFIGLTGIFYYSINNHNEVSLYNHHEVQHLRQTIQVLNTRIKKLENTSNSHNAVGDLLGVESIKKNKNENEVGLSMRARLAKRKVYGLPDDIDELFQPYIDTIENPEAAEDRKKYAVNLSKAILFHGPPGTGKTSIAKHIGEILGYGESEIKIATPATLLASHVGESEKAIMKLFQVPQGEKALIIIDEFEGFALERTKLGTDHSNSRVNTFLQALDGLESEKNNFLLIGITNNKDIMDKAILRRFTQQLSVDLPNEEQMLEIYENYIGALYQKKLARISHTLA